MTYAIICSILKLLLAVCDGWYFITKIQSGGIEHDVGNVYDFWSVMVKREPTKMVYRYWKNGWKRITSKYNNFTFYSVIPQLSTGCYV